MTVFHPKIRHFRKTTLNGYSPDLPRAGFSAWQPSLVRSVAVVIEQVLSEEKTVKLSKFCLARNSKVSFTENSVRFWLELSKGGKSHEFFENGQHSENVDVLLRCELFLAYEWSFGVNQSMSGVGSTLLGVHTGIDPLTAQIIAKIGNKMVRGDEFEGGNFEANQELSISGFKYPQAYRAATGHRQIEFIKNLEPKIKDIARFLIAWRDTFNWTTPRNSNSKNTRPSSYCLVLQGGFAKMSQKRLKTPENC